jgi:hypothetical protein
LSKVAHMIEKIVSGGQTGADRIGLDWAIWHDIPHGGWCPKFRKAEDGTIPPQYLLTETPKSDYVQRTEWNARDSDGTLIFSLSDKLSRGSAKTAFFAERHGKPYLHVHPGLSYRLAADVLQFVRDNNIKVLNIAGTRASKEPYIGKFVKQIMEDAFFPKPHGLLTGSDEG